MIDRRTLLCRSLAAGAASLLPRALWAADWDATVAAARKEGRAVLYSAGIARVEEPAIAAFGRESGIAVDYARPGGGEIIMRKFEQELTGGAATADVCSLSDYALGLYAREKGWTATPDLPNAAKLAPAFAMKDAGIYPTAGMALVIAVNTDMIADGQEPRTYAALADPRYKGQVLFGAPENAGTSTLLIKALVEQHGWDFVRALRANDVGEMRLQAEAMQAVARGEKPICVVAQAWGHLYREQGAPVRLIFPEDGTVMARYCLFVSSKSPRPAAAAVLANHLLSAEYQAKLADQMGAYGSNADAPTPKGLPPVSQLKVYEPNLAELMAERGQIIDTWRKIMS
ncbi:ABC transporter substrate-binding protein [Azospirillum sp. ST 5-10]|uniref:ABC transporter substrate-binding protein n=1 Tax=unclassified Azospirillum TaxID=2630922 RepID=UPI003F4A70D0